MTNTTIATTSSTQLPIQKDDKVRWVGGTNGDTYEHFGIVLDVNDNNVLFQTAYGEMNISQDDGQFHVHIGELPIIVREVEIDNSNTEAKSKGVREGSKQHKCIELVREMKKEDDKVKSAVVVAAIMETFDMSNAGAKTYYYNSTKYIKENG